MHRPNEGKISFMDSNKHIVFPSPRFRSTFIYTLKCSLLKQSWWYFVLVSCFLSFSLFFRLLVSHFIYTFAFFRLFFLLYSAKSFHLRRDYNDFYEFYVRFVQPLYQKQNSINGKTRRMENPFSLEHTACFSPFFIRSAPKAINEN